MKRRLNGFARSHVALTNLANIRGVLLSCDLRSPMILVQALHRRRDRKALAPQSPASRRSVGQAFFACTDHQAPDAQLAARLYGIWLFFQDRVRCLMYWKYVASWRQPFWLLYHQQLRLGLVSTQSVSKASSWGGTS
jgi:hypothetical protein